MSKQSTIFSGAEKNITEQDCIDILKEKNYIIIKLDDLDTTQVKTAKELVSFFYATLSFYNRSRLLHYGKTTKKDLKLEEVNPAIVLNDLIDEFQFKKNSVYKENVDSFLFQEKEVRVFYPLRKYSMTHQIMKSLLLHRTEARDKDLCLLYIPDLLSTLCANEGIPKEKFLNALVKLYKQEPSDFHLEAMSSLRSDDRCKSHYGYINFPIVNGIMRSHVCVTSHKGGKL